MSTSVDLLIWSLPRHSHEVYMALVQRFLEREVGHSVYVNERRAGRPHVTKLDVTPTPDVMRALLNSTFHEYGELYVNVGYKMLSGGTAPAAMKIFGDKSFAGPPDSGTCSVTTDWSALLKPFRTIRIGRDYLDYERESILEDVSLGPKLVELRQAMDTTCRDMEEMFLRACDLLSDVDTGIIQHGAIHVNDLWNTPLTSCMIYHRDAWEFARDFARIYLCDQNPYITPDEIFRQQGSSIWDVELKFGSKPRSADKDFLREMYHPSPPPKSSEAAVLKFRHQLDHSRAEHLASLPPGEIRRFVAQAVEETPYTWMRDFGARGIVIGTRPISNFRNLYPRISELAGVITLA